MVGRWVFLILMGVATPAWADDLVSITQVVGALATGSLASGLQGDVSRIYQSGSDNIAQTQQTGVRDVAAILQAGKGDMSIIQQTGAHETATLSQIGNGLALTIHQVGSGQSVSITQRR